MIKLFSVILFCLISGVITAVLFKYFFHYYWLSCLKLVAYLFKNKYFFVKNGIDGYDYVNNLHKIDIGKFGCLFVCFNFWYFKGRQLFLKNSTFFSRNFALFYKCSLEYLNCIILIQIHWFVSSLKIFYHTS